MASKKAQVVELDEDDVELEEVEEIEEPAPKATKKKAAAPAEPAEEEVWGVRALIDLIKEKTGKDYTPREVRTLLRKLARDGGKIDREVIPGNKSRYSWSGPEDPEVKVILRAVKGGEIEASKKAALDKLKADKAAKAASKPKATKPAAADEDDDDDE